MMTALCKQVPGGLGRPAMCSVLLNIHCSPCMEWYPPCLALEHPGCSCFHPTTPFTYSSSKGTVLTAVPVKGICLDRFILFWPLGCSGEVISALGGRLGVGCLLSFPVQAPQWVNKGAACVVLLLLLFSHWLCLVWISPGLIRDRE